MDNIKHGNIHSSELPDTSAMADTKLARRDVMAAGLALGFVSLLPGSGLAAESHKHKKHAEGAEGSDVATKVIENAGKCVVAGDLCIAHCITEIQSGDTGLADCMKAATVMSSVCKTMMTLAAVDSPASKEMGKVVMATCEACRDECAKHAMHHAECKSCMDACKDTLSALGKANFGFYPIG